MLRLYPIAIPLDAFYQPHPSSAEDIQSTADSQVNRPVTELLHSGQILQRPPTSSISDRYRAPTRKVSDEVLVDTSL